MLVEERCVCLREGGVFMYERERGAKRMRERCVCMRERGRGVCV